MNNRVENKTTLKAVKLFEKYSWILGIAIVLYVISVYLNYYSDIYENEVEAHGVVYKTTSMRTGKFSGLIYYYKFKYKENEYYGTSTKTPPDKVVNGRIFTVKFSANDPNKNEIFFEQEYVRKIVSTNGGTRDTLYLKKK